MITMNFRTRALYLVVSIYGRRLLSRVSTCDAIFPVHMGGFVAVAAGPVLPGAASWTVLAVGWKTLATILTEPLRDAPLHQLFARKQFFLEQVSQRQRHEDGCAD